MSSIFRVEPPRGVRLVVGCVSFAVALIAALTLPPSLAPIFLRLATTYALVAVGFGLLAALLPSPALQLRLQLTTGLIVAAATTVLWQMETTVGAAARASGSEASLALTIVLAAALCLAAAFDARPVVVVASRALGLKGLWALVTVFVVAPTQPLSGWAQVPLVWNGVWIVGSIVAAWIGRPQPRASLASSPRAA